MLSETPVGVGWHRTMLLSEKLHIIHKNSLAIGTKREVARNSDVDVGWERSEPIV